MAEIVREFDEGSVVDSWLEEEDGERVVKQSAERSSGDIRHDLLVTGGRLLQNLDFDRTPDLKSFDYDNDAAVHSIEYIEGRHPGTADDWRKVGHALSEFHSQKIDRLNYGQFQGYTDWEHLGLVRAYHHWNEFLDQNIGNYIDSISDEVLSKPQTELLHEAWDKSAVPKEPEKSVIHADIVPSNTIINGEEAYLIDLDQAMHGHKTFDLIKAEESLVIRGINPEPLTGGYKAEENISSELRDAYRSYSLAYEAWSIDDENSKKATRISKRADIML